MAVLIEEGYWRFAFCRSPQKRSTHFRDFLLLGFYGFTSFPGFTCFLYFLCFSAFLVFPVFPASPVFPVSSASRFHRLYLFPSFSNSHTFAAMQKNWIPAVTALLILTSCENDLNLTAPWKDIPIIYGVLSPADTAHYIRIEKAFLDPTISALEIARIPDSLYYDEIEAVLINIGTGERLTLQEIDGANDGYPRNDGVFATSPNILYKVSAADANLLPGERYRLEVTRSDQLPVVTAETTIVGRPTINRPQSGDKLRFASNSSYRILWSEATAAAFYDVILYVNYDEYNVADPSNIESKVAGWKVSGVTTNTEFEVPGIEFYKFLSASLESSISLRRIFKGIDIQVRAGGIELYEFQRVQLANTGITSAGGDIPQYTNLSEGVGIFSSSNRFARLNLELHEDSLDSLISGSFTRHLNFQ